MRSALIAPVLAAAVLAGCSNHHPVPAHGHITGRTHSPESMMWMPGITSCTKYGCTTSPGYPIFIPESWDLEVTDLHNGGWKGSVGVDPVVFHRCHEGDLWPDCSVDPPHSSTDHQEAGR